MASRMNDLRVFQGQRRRRIRLGPQGDLKKNDNVQSLNTRWDETIFAMKTQPDKKMLDNFGYRQLQQAEQLKPLLSLYIEDTIQKGDSRDYTRLKKRWWSDAWNRQFVRNVALFVTDNLNSPPLVLVQPTANLRAKKKQRRLRAMNRQQKVSALEEISVE